MLEKGLQESSSEEEDDSITIGADFDELVRIHERKEEEV
jgi:hypothetical protein